MRALVGIPRAALALAELRADALPHITVADNPTTGGVWVAIGAAADVRIAVSGAVLGFSGPRVVTAMTDRPLVDGGNTAESAYAAGLVDLVATHDEIGGLLARTLDALRADDPQPVAPPPLDTPPTRDAAAQLAASREGARPSGDELIETMLTDVVPLRGADDVTHAALGRLAGRSVVVVALAGPRSAMPGPGGYALLSRAATLAGALDLALVVLVDTPGADPHRETDGLVPAMGQALLDVLQTPAPTIALVHGEGGSGGALAGAVTDVVGVGELGWFAALGPEGAAAALRTSPAEAAELMRITPTELIADGFADAFVPSGGEAAWCATAIDAIREVPTEQRMTNRCKRWSSALPNQM
jgi:acetyl-CoA carboxylase carboxyl transferase subunit beta